MHSCIVYLHDPVLNCDLCISRLDLGKTVLFRTDWIFELSGVPIQNKYWRVSVCGVVTPEAKPLIFREEANGHWTGQL